MSEEIPLEIDIVSGLITIGILLVFNAILAMAEVALISARKARLQGEINKGDTRAGIALKLVEDPNQFLSVIQIGITSIDLMTGVILPIVAVVALVAINGVFVAAEFSLVASRRSRINALADDGSRAARWKSASAEICTTFPKSSGVLR